MFAVLPPLVLFVIAPKRGFAPAVLGVDPNAGADVDAVLPKREPDEGVFDGWPKANFGVLFWSAMIADVVKRTLRWRRIQTTTVGDEELGIVAEE